MFVALHELKQSGVLTCVLATWRYVYSQRLPLHYGVHYYHFQLAERVEIMVTYVDHDFHCGLTDIRDNASCFRQFFIYLSISLSINCT